MEIIHLVKNMKRDGNYIYLLDQAEWGALRSPERLEIFIAVFGLLIYCSFRNMIVNGL